MTKFFTLQIRKAVIPVAGLATRLFPATRLVPKALLPVMDAQGNIVPLIHTLVEEAVMAGIERVGLIIHPSQRELFESYFHGNLPFSSENAANTEASIVAHKDRMQKLLGRVEIVTQAEPLGFGHAVYRARAWVGGESFLLMLGDHLFRSHTSLSCSQQILQAASQQRSSLIGLVQLPIEQAPRRGTAAVLPNPEGQGKYKITQIIEKPDVKIARTHLISKFTAPNRIFCFFGCYILRPHIFDILEEDIESNKKRRGEFQLTEALDRLRQDFGCEGQEIDGDSMDIGSIDSYRQAFSFLHNTPNSNGSL
jgi:UTP--glucose-1-phosphate uridylyltransferase